MSTEKPLRIVVVGTANVARSPMTEAWLRAALPADLVEVESVGTTASKGQQMDARSRDLTIRFGGDPRAAAARKLDEHVVADADLVLAMATEHRAAVVAMRPALIGRTFTIVELERLISIERFSSLRRLAAGIDTGPRARLESMLAAIAAHRSDERASTDPSIDVVDPFQRDDDVAQRSAAQLLPAVETTVELINTALRASAPIPVRD